MNEVTIGASFHCLAQVKIMQSQLQAVSPSCLDVDMYTEQQRNITRFTGCELGTLSPVRDHMRSQRDECAFLTDIVKL